MLELKVDHTHIVYSIMPIRQTNKKQSQVELLILSRYVVCVSPWKCECLGIHQVTMTLFLFKLLIWQILGNTFLVTCALMVWPVKDL